MSSEPAGKRGAPRRDEPESRAARGQLREADLAAYAGRWVAIVRGQITGVGSSPEQARRASKYQRSKEEPLVMFVAPRPNSKEKKNKGK